MTLSYGRFTNREAKKLHGRLRILPEWDWLPIGAIGLASLESAWAFVQILALQKS